MTGNNRRTRSKKPVLALLYPAQNLHTRNWNEKGLRGENSVRKNQRHGTALSALLKVLLNDAVSVGDT